MLREDADVVPVQLNVDASIRNHDNACLHYPRFEIMVASDRAHVNLMLRACSLRDRFQRARDNGGLLPRELPRRLAREMSTAN